MKMLLRDLGDKLQTAIGDGTSDISEEFLIGAYNWAINELPLVPKLDKLFSKHKQFNLDARNHYRWNLNDSFRRLLDIPMLNFYTSTGGDPCKLKICHRAVKDFYEKNGLVDLKQSGAPCEYTLEVEDDNVWLVFDRPLNIPVIVDYIAYGIPKPATSLDDEIEISAIAENLILDVMKTYYLHEADDYAFAADVSSYLDNKKVIEAIQALHKQWGQDAPRILGEV